MTENGCKSAGLGLRTPHLREVIRETPDVPWFEVHVCNYLGGGLNRALLHQVRANYPLSFHGVNLNLAGIDPLDRDYLQRLKTAVDEFQPALVSEHACFNSYADHYFHDLLPIPFTDEAVIHLAGRVRQVQDLLGRRILLENLSRYFSFDESYLSESAFMTAVCEEADCGLLLDLNNAYVNQINLGENLDLFVDGLPLERVGEIHLAGFTEQNGMLIDTHGAPVSDPVWQAYARFCERRSDVPCLIEWDTNLPAFAELQAQRQIAQQIQNNARNRSGTNQVGELTA